MPPQTRGRAASSAKGPPPASAAGPGASPCARSRERHQSTLLLANDRIDVALALEADGVQLPEAGLPVEIARKLLGSRRWVGSLSSRPEGVVRRGRKALTTRLWRRCTRCRQGRLRSVLRALPVDQRHVRLPVYALGGVRAEDVAELRRSAGHTVPGRHPRRARGSDPKFAAHRLSCSRRGLAVRAGAFLPQGNGFAQAFGRSGPLTNHVSLTGQPCRLPGYGSPPRWRRPKKTDTKVVPFAGDPRCTAALARSHSGWLKRSLHAPSRSWLET